MDRRDFVRLGAVAGALTLRGKPFSEAVITEAGRPRVANDRFSIAPFALEETTLADLQSAMASGRLTARSITQQYIDRIQALDLALDFD